MAKTLRTVKVGDEARVGYVRRGRELMDWNRFMGFGICDSVPQSTEELFPDAKSLFEHLGVKSFREADEAGHRVKAWFYSVKYDFPWAAYRFRGAWVCGSSADRLKIQ